MRNKITDNSEWFDFYRNLMGYKLFKNNRPVPKYIVYWSGITSDDIFSGRSVVKAKTN
jgi:hypothetical protein